MAYTRIWDTHFMANIRINDKDKQILDEICKNREVNHAEGFHLAIGLLHRQEIDRQIYAYYDAVNSNKEALEAHRKEIEIFDQSTSDCLDVLGSDTDESGFTKAVSAAPARKKKRQRLKGSF